MAELGRLGMPLDFEPTPVREIVCFDSRGAPYRLSSAGRPVFYLIKRGTAEDSLDTALVRQALAAGAAFRWSTRVEHLDETGIVAGGPHAADIIAVGNIFATDMADGCYAAVSESLAPDGYAYLLVQGGVGTVAACLSADFHNEKQYLERTIEFFARHAGLRWSQARPFGGSGNVLPQAMLTSGSLLYAGESAGLQDPLFGFGVRFALLSGHFAAQAWLAGSAELYERLWRARLRDYVRAGTANRRLYHLIGESGRQYFLGHIVAGTDPRSILQRVYRPTPIKIALSLLSRHHRPARPVRPGCDCTWCRCHALGPSVNA